MSLLYLDSNIIIAALAPHEKDSGTAREVIRGLGMDKYRGLSSSIMYGEVFARHVPDVSSLNLGDFFSGLSSFSTEPADDHVCKVAGQLRGRYGSRLRLADAIHLATALEYNADLLVTNDLPFAKIASQVITTKTLADYK